MDDIEQHLIEQNFEETGSGNWGEDQNNPDDSFGAWLSFSGRTAGVVVWVFADHFIAFRDGEEPDDSAARYGRSVKDLIKAIDALVTN